MVRFFDEEIHSYEPWIAIGHANIKRLIGEFANLSIWIN